MTSPAVANSKGPQLPRMDLAGQELFLLETLKSLLDGAIRCLSGGEPAPLLEMGRQIGSTAQQLLALVSQLSPHPANPWAQQKRRKLLSQLGQQLSFCRALLRRWRRSITLRQQLLDVENETVPYTEARWLELK